MMAYKCIPCGRIGEGDECPGQLNWPDSDRFARGEISLKQALKIARSTHESNCQRYARELADAHAARERTRAWIASWPRCEKCGSVV